MSQPMSDSIEQKMVELAEVVDCSCACRTVTNEPTDCKCDFETECYCIRKCDCRNFGYAYCDCHIRYLKLRRAFSRRCAIGRGDGRKLTKGASKWEKHRKTKEKGVFGVEKKPSGTKKKQKTHFYKNRESVPIYPPRKSSYLFTVCWILHIQQWILHEGYIGHVPIKKFDGKNA